jgi:hypothetical protein
MYCKTLITAALLNTVVQCEGNLRGFLNVTAPSVNAIPQTNTSRMLSSETLTAWTTDGSPPVDCSKFDRLSVIKGLSLQHRRPNLFASYRKDDIQLQCSTNFDDHVGITDRATVNNYWTGFASEEHGQVVRRELIDPRRPGFQSNIRNIYGRVCGEREFVTGIACDGNYCDNVSVRCTQIAGRRYRGNAQGWTDYQTDGTVDLGGDDRAVAGFACKNRLCLQKQSLWGNGLYVEANLRGPKSLLIRIPKGHTNE